MSTPERFKANLKKIKKPKPDLVIKNELREEIYSWRKIIGEDKLNKQKQLEEKRLKKFKNHAVAELNSQLSIERYVKSLKAELRLLARVKKWGPKEGEISYAFPYSQDSKEVTVKVSYESYNLPTQGGSASPTRTTHYWDTKQEQKFKNVLGIILNYQGDISVKTAECFRFRNDSLNPLNWKLGGKPECKSLGDFNVVSEEGLEQFAQSLQTFFLEQQG